MSKHYCQVSSCVYYAEATVREIQVCRMHDVDAVERILDRGMVPGDCISYGEDVVLPVAADNVSELSCAPRSALRGPIPSLGPRPANIAVSYIRTGLPAEAWRLRRRFGEEIGLWRLRRAL